MKKAKKHYENLIIYIIIVLTLLIVFEVVLEQNLLMLITLIISIFFGILNIDNLIVIDKKKYTRNFLEEALNKLFKNVQYIPNKYIDLDKINSANMVNSFNKKVAGKNYISAEYKGIKFIQSDIHLYNEKQYTISTPTATATNQNIITHFKGTWLIFNLKHHTKQELYIIDNKFKYELELYNRPGYKKDIKSKSKDFNYQYKIITNNKNNKNLLTTKLINTIIKLNKELKDGSIMIGLIDNKLHIAIETNKETFLDKYQSGTSETKQEEYKYFLRKYKLITTIVDILNKK